MTGTFAALANSITRGTKSPRAQSLVVIAHEHGFAERQEPLHFVEQACGERLGDGLPIFAVNAHDLLRRSDDVCRPAGAP